MPISANSNLNSLIAQKNLGHTQNAFKSTLEKLSTGSRINKAVDDIIGMVSSEKLSAEIRSLSQAGKNANDGMSLLQTAESGLSQIGDHLSRMRELAVQAGNGTLSDDDRANINTEYQSLSEEINRITGTSQFNGLNLLDGTDAANLNLQVGTDGSANSVAQISIANSQSSALGAPANSIDVQSLSTATGAQNALSVLDSAIDEVQSNRSSIGASQNQLTSTVNNINSSIENHSATRSRIKDTDMADAASKLALNKMLMQSGVSILAQANTSKSTALRLLG